jgi:tetratricopeptide (TPR) repeat protein
MGSTPVAQEPVAGARIADRYEVVRTLGTGGMATVYEVLDLSSCERLALKQLSLSAEQAMPRARTLFQREYHALSQLAHPCIVAVRDYGLDEQGPYYTMELLDGQDLRARAPLPWLVACRLMRDVASCLGVLHARGLLHRDVHYRNVRCTSDGRARLLDFGTLSTFGAASDIAGMAPFVAPEALRGQPLDARCDLYSLGCLTYWVLVGEHAYPAFRHDELEALWARGTPRLSERLPDAPAALDALLASMMAMDPIARPGSAAEVIHRLGAIAGLPESEPVAVGRSYLQSPRLVGRQRELERFRLAVGQHLRARPSAPPAPAFSSEQDVGATGRFRPVGASSRATGALRTRERVVQEFPLLVVEGPAGAGRSRMLQELVLESRLSGALVLSTSAAVVRAEEYGVVNALLLQLRKLRPDLEQALPDADLALLLDTAEQRLGPMVRGTGASFRGDDRPMRRQRVMREVLLQAAAAAGLLIAIDDFEVCDVASAALLSSLLEIAAGKRVLVAAALRSEAAVAAPVAVDWLCAHGRVLSLQPLDEGEVEALMRSLFGAAPHLKLLSSWVLETARGNPLSCMELVRHLVETQVIRYEHGAWLLPPRPASHGLPQSLSDALRGLVAGLTPTARALAETFCMFDTPLAVERCVELSGTGESKAFDALSELVARNVLIGDGVRYRLVHRELREVLLESMAKQKRRALHLRIGHWLLERGKRPLDAARHLMDGGAEVEGAAQLVKTARANPASVVGAALRIGERGTEVLRRAIDVCARTSLSPADRAHFGVSCMTVEAFLEHGDLSRVPALITQLEHDAGLEGYAERDPAIAPREWLRSSFRAAAARHAALPEHARGLPQKEALGLLPLCAFHLNRAFAARADLPSLAGVQRMVEPYAHVANPVAAVMVGYVNAITSIVRGELESGRTGLRAVVATLDEMDKGPAGARPASSGWRVELGLMQAMASTPDSDHSFAIVDDFERRGSAMFALELTVTRMLRHLFRGEQDAADELAERMEALLVQRPGGGYQNRGWVTSYAAAAYAQIGDPQGLQQAVAQLERLTEQQAGHLPTLEVMRAALHRLRGELDEAERAYRRVLDEHGAFARVGTALEAIPGLVQVLCLQERFAEALDFATRRLEGEGAVPASERPRLRRSLLPELAQCMAREGQAEAAGVELDAALAEAGDEPLACFRLHAARAAVALERGEVELMQQHLRRAGKRARAAGSSALVARHEVFAEQLSRRRRILEQPPS